MSYFIDAGPQIVAFIFLLVFVIQFALVFLLYKSNRQSNIKISDLESLLGVTADRVLSIKEKTNAVTYQEVVSRLKSGHDTSAISKEANVSPKELEALKRILEATDQVSFK